MRCAAILCVALIPLLSGWTYGTTAPQTADPLANQTTQNVLTYLQNVEQRSTHSIVTGQMAVNAFAPLTDYNNTIPPLYAATGAYPGLIGADYGEWDFNVGGGIGPNSSACWTSATGAVAQCPNYTSLNAILQTSWTAGSLIEISWHQDNPWYGDYWSDGRCNGGTVADLTIPGSAVRTAYLAQLAYIAAGLQQLQAAGVTVLWRPLLEQNGNTTWWWAAGCNPGWSPEPFKALWQDMFNVLTNTYHLHNLLWVFSSNGPVNGGQPSGLTLYPGSTYVDIVGLDDYHDITGPQPGAFADKWTAWAALGKPLVYAERGPHEIDGTSKMFQTLMPDAAVNQGSTNATVAYFMAWGPSSSGAFDILSSGYAPTVMGDPNAANQSDVKRVLDCMAGAANYSARVACVLQ